jgi:hypothetical protein
MVHVAGEMRDSDIKVFCFFSSEKKTFLPKSQPAANAAQLATAAP